MKPLHIVFFILGIFGIVMWAVSAYKMNATWKDENLDGCDKIDVSSKWYDRMWLWNIFLIVLALIGICI